MFEQARAHEALVGPPPKRRDRFGRVNFVHAGNTPGTSPLGGKRALRGVASGRTGVPTKAAVPCEHEIGLPRLTVAPSAGFGVACRLAFSLRSKARDVDQGRL
jgi:hypothetical protein